MHGAAEYTWLTEQECKPPVGIVARVASELGALCQCQLFGFDLAVDTPSKEGTPCSTSSVYVVDINYFPGYSGVPNFPTELARFLVSNARGPVSAMPHELAAVSKRVLFC